MLQAIGLTSTSRHHRARAVDDLTFEARPGDVTALLGARGSGKSTALRLMLGLEAGRGVAYFRGRPLHAMATPAREVGVLLADVPGHPARTARGQLRMLCAAAGVPVSRADDMLDLVGIAALRDARLGSLSLGMGRRLGLASALLGDPHTLLLDAPSRGLSPREHSWLFGLLRAHAAHGGTVLYTTADPKEAAGAADRVVTIDHGRLVADQDAADFARTRLRPRVAVRTPHTGRLAAALSRESRAGHRSVEVVIEGANRLSVYGSSCAEIGDAAFRYGVPVHRLAEETGDAGPRPLSAAVRTGEPAEGTARAEPAGPGPVPARCGRAGPRLTAGDAARPVSPDDGLPYAPEPGADPHPAVPQDPGCHRAAPHGAASRSPAVRRPDAGPDPAASPPCPGVRDAGHEPAARSRIHGHAFAHMPVAGAGALGPAAPPPGARGSTEPGPDASVEPRAGGAPRTGPLRSGRGAVRFARPAAEGQPSARPRRGASRAGRLPSQPLQPLRYELRRFLGVRTTLLVVAAVLVSSAALSALLGHVGRTPLPGLLGAWPDGWPLPPAAVGAGVLGALSFGEEFRYPALAAARGTVPRRLGLLLAKLAVTAVAALAIGGAVVVLDAQALWLLYGLDPLPVPGNWAALCLSWSGLLVGSAWSGLLAAGTFRGTAAGVAAVAVVPVVVVPLVRKALDGPSGGSLAGFAGRLQELTWPGWPHEVDRWLLAGLRVFVQPVGAALMLSLVVLLCSYLLIGLRGRARW
ncbi:ATP-binding cassette domain-containing protein [Streptomyces pacificus]|uniref:ATP-binding cassette domain-containing protein n=1 Tax=Streptomyces pacificus TaxID=2705029 RepID=A0A6A0B040_9ACTN|nr:ATP-binding cassette domain-containing protein [Streptomyces pacificus]GFH38442.1 ATP-binding cassette domain-containing protein [Streptomyces pacificus]